MLELRCEIKGDEILSRRLRGLSTKIKDFRTPLQKSATLLLKDIRLNFETEGGMVGGWAPLKPATIEGRLREGYGASPILHRSGRYKRSFKGEIGRNKLVIDAFGVEYHKYHQSPDPRTRLPRRRTLFLREQSKREIVRNFQEYIKLK
jgi:phage gpG-like protein